MKQAILAIDEGTTGTRACLVAPDGSISALEYHRLDLDTQPGGVVEQSPEQIAELTIGAIRRSLASAELQDTEVLGIAISAQRLTAVLWDARSGAPLAPALVWQDTRNARRIPGFAAEWDATLIQRTGRGVGVQSPYLWAADLLQSNEPVRLAYERGDLRFGSIDSWLMWKLSGGNVWATSATMAHAMGAYDLRSGEYIVEWPDALGFPADLLPPIVNDSGEIGETSSAIIGRTLPILAAIGDQQAGALGLGVHSEGQAMCVHGTGSFVILTTGMSFPKHAGLFPQCAPNVARRGQDGSHFAVETFVPTTGAAIDWLCEPLGLFESPQEVSALAATGASTGGVTYLPTLTGFSFPVFDTRGRSALLGLGLTTSKAEVARAVLEGIAHSVASCLEADQQVAALTPTHMVVGGGLSASDTLMQLQSDLCGIPIVRPAEAEAASLRGAAFLAGSGRLWESLEDAMATVGNPTVFEPQISPLERGKRRTKWQARMHAESQLTRA